MVEETDSNERTGVSVISQMAARRRRGDTNKKKKSPAASEVQEEKNLKIGSGRKGSSVVSQMAARRRRSGNQEKIRELAQRNTNVINSKERNSWKERAMTERNHRRRSAKPLPNYSLSDSFTEQQLPNSTNDTTLNQKTRSEFKGERTMVSVTKVISRSSTTPKSIPKPTSTPSSLADPSLSKFSFEDTRIEPRLSATATSALSRLSATAARLSATATSALSIATAATVGSNTNMDFSIDENLGIPPETPDTFSIDDIDEDLDRTQGSKASLISKLMDFPSSRKRGTSVGVLGRDDKRMQRIMMHAAERRKKEETPRNRQSSGDSTTLPPPSVFSGTTSVNTSNNSEMSNSSDDDEDEKELDRKLLEELHHLNTDRPITPTDDTRETALGRFSRVRALWGKRDSAVEKKREPDDPWTVLLHSINVNPALKQEVTHMQRIVRKGKHVDKKAMKMEMKQLLEERAKWMTATSKVKCVVRVRPVPPEANTSECPSDSTITINATTRNVDLRKSVNTHTFNYDRVYGMNANNEYVYKTIARPLVASIFHRKKVSMFSYGATGSGKTYTMIGVEKDRGIFFRTIQDIYQLLAFPENKGLTADLSMFEVYGSGIFDLLNERKKLKARNDRKGNTRVTGLTHQVCDTMGEMLAASDRATRFRKVGSTHANDVSSRSHAIIRIRIVELKRNKVQGIFQIIDLAGSERARDVGKVSKERQREGAEINKSLLALKECIRIMGKNQKKKSGSKKEHVSFRSSVLTRLLKSSLKGNTKTIMVACVAPTKKSMEPTMNTLRYATQLKNMKAVVSQKVMEQDDDELADEVAKAPRHVEIVRQFLQDARDLMGKETVLQGEQEQLLNDLERLSQENKSRGQEFSELFHSLKQVFKRRAILSHGLQKIRENLKTLERKVTSSH
eukprot:CAMPEP_0114509240 /NCGR_PEP_ID=MMETSP0109-20121206/13090_1 /TAXON_ID=29199 /ORGANISM="Chlorarachnion reptans, Strain CCCM449" /LENGTH=906 /DNA_ID=CAMNT_0001688351 /DNA_START=81 /DNA_END=2801 /DNA_ORIENTATION=+